VACAYVSVLTQFYLNILKSRIRNATFYGTGKILSLRQCDAAHIQEDDGPESDVEIEMVLGVMGEGFITGRR